MAEEWKADLVGGPFDGDRSRIDAPLPAKLYVVHCRQCDDTHWFTEKEKGAEKYVKDEEFPLERKVKYVYRDLDLDAGGPHVTQREKEPVAA